MGTFKKSNTLRGYGLFLTLLLLWLGSLLGALWFDNVLAWTAGLLYIAYDTWLIAYVAWKTRHLAEPPVAPATITTHTPTTLGVLIPARNEAAVLAQTLDALLDQNDRPDAILVIDDGSNDQTLDLLETRYGVICRGHGLFSSSRLPQLRVLRKANSGKADSLNQAWPLLNTDVVVTLDADTRLPRDVARELVGCMAHPLNRPRIDPRTRRVVEGHAILQPRVGPSSASRSSPPVAGCCALAARPDCAGVCMRPFSALSTCAHFCRAQPGCNPMRCCWFPAPSPATGARC